MARQSISLTTPNDEFLNSLVSSGEFSSKSEVVNYLIRENRISEFGVIRNLLIAAEEGVKKHGFSEKSTSEIKKEVINRKQKDGGL